MRPRPDLAERRFIRDSRRCAHSFAIFALLIAAVVPAPLPAAPAQAQPFWGFYDQALQAIENEQWQQAVDLLQQALATQSDESRRMRKYGMVFGEYFPFYHLGLAHYRLGDCRAALAAWQRSEQDGDIRAMPQYDQLVAMREGCEQQMQALSEKQGEAARGIADAEDQARRVSLTSDDLTDIWTQDPELGPREAEAERLLEQARARHRDGQSSGLIADLEEATDLARRARDVFVEVLATAQERRTARATSARPTQPQGQPAEGQRQTAPAPTGGGTEPGVGRPAGAAAESGTGAERRKAAADEPSEARTPAGEGGDDRPAASRDAAESGDSADRSPRPRPSQLDAAVDAYFESRYDDALEMLGSASRFADPRARLHASLFRAAASWALWVRGGELSDGLHRDAVAAVSACRVVDPGFEPDPRYFSPRFVAFFRDAS